MNSRRLPIVLAIVILSLGIAEIVNVLSHRSTSKQPTSTTSSAAPSPINLPTPQVISSPPDGGCARSPSACGFPDETNVGVPPSTKLLDVPAHVRSGPGWSWNRGGWVDITSNGTVFSGYRVAGTVNVVANDVTVQNCVVSFKGGGGSSFGVAIRHASRTTVQHCDISGPRDSGGSDPSRLTTGVKDIYFDSTGTRILANNIYDAVCGVHMDSGTIDYNYIHNLASYGPDHTDAVLSSAGGTQSMTITHNTLLNQLDQTSAVALFEDGGGFQHDKTVSDNLLGGGSYALYAAGGDHGGRPPKNIHIVGNRFTSIYHSNSGTYGPVAYYDATAPGASFTGNVWDATGDQLNE